MQSQKIGRLATVGKDCTPHVVPVVFEIGKSGNIVFGGKNLGQSLKFKQISKNPNIAFVVDSVKSSPWRPMGVEISGTSRVIVSKTGENRIEIAPKKIVSWGL